MANAILNFHFDFLNTSLSRVQAKMDKVDSEQMTVLTYLSIYFAYLIIKTFQLMVRRLWSCSKFKKNVSHKKEFADGLWKMENVWLNGVSEFNTAVKSDSSFHIPAWLIMTLLWSRKTTLEHFFSPPWRSTYQQSSFYPRGRRLSCHPSLLLNIVARTSSG